jgi:intracellular septation protein A
MLAQKAQSLHRMLFALLPTILAVAVLPYIIYRLASPYMSTIAALLMAAIPPALVTTTGLIRQRRLNLFGTLALAGIAVKLISALLFKDIRLILISDSLMTGVYGIIMLLSLLFGKPLLLTLAQSMQTNTSPEQYAVIENRWRDAGSSFLTLLTIVWGTGLLLGLLISIVLTFILTVQQFVLINPLVQYSLFGSLILWSQVYGALRRRKHRLLMQQQ